MMEKRVFLSSSASSRGWMLSSSTSIAPGSDWSMWIKRAGVMSPITALSSLRVGSFLTRSSALSLESFRSMCEKTWTRVAPVLEEARVLVGGGQRRNQSHAMKNTEKDCLHFFQQLLCLRVDFLLDSIGISEIPSDSWGLVVLKALRLEIKLVFSTSDVPDFHTVSIELPSVVASSCCHIVVVATVFRIKIMILVIQSAHSTHCRRSGTRNISEMILNTIRLDDLPKWYQRS